MRNGLLAVVTLVIIAAFVRTTANPPREQIWCEWEKSAEAAVLDQKDATIYAFEDLAAYHLWFAAKQWNLKVIKVNGVAGIVEDKAYFLPRGMQDAVKVAYAGDVPNAADLQGEKVYFAFRDTGWNEHHQPIEFFKRKGYRVREVYASDAVQGMRVFLGEASK